MDNVSLQKLINRIPLLKFGYFESFLSDSVPTLEKDTFAIINTQPNNMQGEHWTMIAKFCHEMCSADFLGNKKYRLLKRHYRPMMPAQLQSHPSFCCLNTIYAAFHLSKCYQEKNTGIEFFDVICFISNYEQISKNFIANVQSM